MTDMNTAVATPFRMTIGETEWKFSPLKFGDWAELTAWARGRVVRLATLTARDIEDATPEERSEMQKAAFDSASEVHVTEKSGRALLSGPDAIAQVVFISLKHEHKDITPDRVMELLDMADDATVIFNQILVASGNADVIEGDDDKGSSPKAKSPTGVQ